MVSALWSSSPTDFPPPAVFFSNIHDGPTGLASGRNGKIVGCLPCGLSMACQVSHSILRFANRPCMHKDEKNMSEISVFLALGCVRRDGG